MFKNLWLKLQFYEITLYDYNKNLDDVFKVLLNKKDILTDIHKGEHYLTLKFSDNTYVKTWRANRFYAYLSRGIVRIDGLEKAWKNYRPSRKTMYKFYVTYDLPIEDCDIFFIERGIVGIN